MRLSDGSGLCDPFRAEKLILFHLSNLSRCFDFDANDLRALRIVKAPVCHIIVRPVSQAGNWVAKCAEPRTPVRGSHPRLESMPDSISTKEVAHVARLAKLVLTSEEEAMYTGQLAAILDHARDIMALDTGPLAPTAHPLQLSNVFRADLETESLQRDEVLSQAPSAEDGRFRVPRILGEAP